MKSMKKFLRETERDKFKRMREEHFKDKRDFLSALTVVQKRFVEEYVKTENATEAYLVARGETSDKIKKSSASTISSALLKKEKIQKAITQQKAILAEQAKLVSKASVKDIVDELCRVAFSDKKDFGELTLCMRDKLKALELLGRYFNIFSEQDRVASVGVGLVLNFNATDNASTGAGAGAGAGATYDITDTASASASASADSASIEDASFVVDDSDDDDTDDSTDEIDS